MHIHFERTGGFAGMNMTFAADTNTLPAEEAEVLHDEVEDACFFELPGHIHDPEAGADRFQYLITIHDGNKQHTVEVGEAALEENMRPLVQHLEILARTRRI